MNLLHQRRWWLLLGTAALFAGGTFIACSGPSNGNDGGPDTGGGDSTFPDGGGKDGSGNEGGNPDGGKVTCEAGISGSCDVYLQNCPSGQDCEATQGPDGGTILSCVSNNNATPEGYACNGNAYTGKCVAGTVCVEGRCSKPCCGDSQCGTAHPEGFQGKCTLSLSFDGNNDFTVCTYSKPCEPFQLQPCGPALACNVDDSAGTSTCSGYASGGDAGLAEHQPCQYKNDCNDGMGCYKSLDGGAANCQFDCYNKGQGGPYDSQIAGDAGAGKGGCPNGETCKLINWGGSLPAWLGICSK